MFTSHLPAFLALLEEACSQAAQAMGEEGVAAVRATMLSGYTRPIRQTGALMNDVRYEAQGPRVTIGSTLPYAAPVHNGTSRTPARPYLTDGILGAEDSLRQAAADTLSTLFA